MCESRKNLLGLLLGAALHLTTRRDSEGPVWQGDQLLLITCLLVTVQLSCGKHKMFVVRRSGDAWSLSNAHSVCLPFAKG